MEVDTPVAKRASDTDDGVHENVDADPVVEVVLRGRGVGGDYLLKRVMGEAEDGGVHVQGAVGAGVVAGGPFFYPVAL